MISGYGNGESINIILIRNGKALIILYADGGSGSRCKTLRSLAEESPGAAGQDTAEARGPQGYGKRRREKTALRRG